MPSYWIGCDLAYSLCNIPFSLETVLEILVLLQNVCTLHIKCFGPNMWELPFKPNDSAEVWSPISGLSSQSLSGTTEEVDVSVSLYVSVFY